MESEPYPWPYDHDPAEALDARRLGVVVCGWQHHWVTTIDPEQVIDERVGRIRAMVDDFRSLGATVLWVRSGAPTAPGGRPSSLPVLGSDDWRLMDGPSPADVVIDTPGLDAFLVEWTDRELRGRGIDRLLMCGLGTEGTVSSTTRSANDRGYECLTAADLVLHHEYATGAASLSSVCMSGGIFGAVGNARDLVAAMRESN